MRTSFFTVLACTIISLQLNAQQVLIENDHIRKELKYHDDSLFASLLQLTDREFNFISKSSEFSFLLNDQKYDGFSGWKLLETKHVAGETYNHVKVHLAPQNPAYKFELALNYRIYPDLPIIRKWITFKNVGNEDLKIEEINVEELNTTMDFVKSVVYHNYGRMKTIGKYVGDWNDPVVVVHDITKRKGIVLGNEATAVLKRTAYHTRRNNIEVGTTHLDSNFPFRKWLKPGESWDCPKVFIGAYANRDDGFEIIDHEVNRFVVKYMQPRILQLQEKPTFVYNTWYPFRTFVSDTLMRDVAMAAADCGIQEFIIDDGWQINYKGQTSSKSWGGNYGDWLVDEYKFKGGLKPTFDYIKSLGMKPGLWVSLGSATKDSRVFQQHPEWFVENAQGKPGNLHYESNEDTGFYSASFGTDWYGYIKERLLRLVKEYGLAYAKLDLAVVTSPYVNNDDISGSYATTHPYHKDHRESFSVIYDRLMMLFDELHQEAPDLFIDCTFETAGKLQLMDYAIARHADGNWLSNFEEPSPVGPLRVRQMAWWRSPAVPASSLVIGNQAIDDPDFEYCLKSLIGTLPIVLGDPRELSAEKRKMIRQWADWMKDMQEKYDYMSYRRDLSGFGEPKEGFWDGWQRINFQTGSGGIFGVFRQGAQEDERRVFLKDLQADKDYVIRQAPLGKEVLRAKGSYLMNTGFKVKLDKDYDAHIFEVGLE